MEIHIRKSGLTEPKSIGDIAASDYEVIGGRFPAAELGCLSDLYGMFREVPAGFEDVIPRGLQIYDVLVLVRQSAKIQTRLTYPMLLIPEAALNGFEAKDLSTNTRPKVDSDSYPPKYIADIWLISLRMTWPSLTQGKKQ